MIISDELEQQFSIIDAKKPSMGEAQRRTLAIHMVNGWNWTGSGSDQSENISKGENHIYVRTDGITRPV